MKNFIWRLYRNRGLAITDLSERGAEHILKNEIIIFLKICTPLPESLRQKQILI